MPQQFTYPGVYVEAVPSGVQAIVGVATSIADTAGQSVPYVSGWADAAPKEIAAYADAVHRISGALEHALGLERTSLQREPLRVNRDLGVVRSAESFELVSPQRTWSASRERTSLMRDRIRESPS